MKRVLSAFAAFALTLGLGLSAEQASVAAPKSTIATTPDGKAFRAAANKPKGVQGRKGMPAAPGTFSTLVTCDGVGTKACYLYNKGVQSGISKNGVQGNFTIGGHSGALSGSDYHTLGEIAVQSSDSQQIVELGWLVDPDINKTGGVGVTNPRPFIYHWVNGVGACYNGCGYVPNTAVTTQPGVTNLTPDTIVNLGIYHDDAQHVWWFKWGSEWMGYLPDTRWTGASPSVSFTRMGLVQLFGEIASPVSKPCSDMGSGITPSSTVTTGASRISSVSYYNSDLSLDSATVNLVTSASPATNAGNPYAGVYAPTPAPPATNIRSFYYGGPMWNSAKTGVGTKGAC